MEFLAFTYPKGLFKLCYKCENNPNASKMIHIWQGKRYDTIRCAGCNTRVTFKKTDYLYDMWNTRNAEKSNYSNSSYHWISRHGLPEVMRLYTDQDQVDEFMKNNYLPSNDDLKLLRETFNKFKYDFLSTSFKNIIEYMMFPVIRGEEYIVTNEV